MLNRRRDLLLLNHRRLYHLANLTIRGHRHTLGHLLNGRARAHRRSAATGARVCCDHRSIHSHRHLPIDRAVAGLRYRLADALRGGARCRAGRRTWRRARVARRVGRYGRCTTGRLLPTTGVIRDAGGASFAQPAEDKGIGVLGDRLHQGSDRQDGDHAFQFPSDHHFTPVTDRFRDYCQGQAIRAGVCGHPVCPQPNSLRTTFGT